MRLSGILGLILPAIFILSSCTGSRKAVAKPKKEHSAELAKYGAALGVELPASINREFIKTVTPWMGTPYKYGGRTKSGVDCSGFVQQVYLDAFGISLPRSSEQMKQQAKSVPASQLKEGDLLFFKTDGKKVSHVGMHLTGKAFIHTSTKKGVMVNTLDEEYYRKTFVGYGTYRKSGPGSLGSLSD